MSGCRMRKASEGCSLWRVGNWCVDNLRAYRNAIPLNHAFTACTVLCLFRSDGRGFKGFKGH